MHSSPDRAAASGSERQGRSRARASPASARRASILDRDGEILAATLDFHSVYADPLYVWDAAEVAQQLATVLPELDVERLTRRLSSNSRYVPIADGLSPRVRQAIHLLGLPGVNFRVEPGRIYPKQRVAAHLVADVPVGVFLSAGMDSTTIAALATEAAQSSLRTVTLGFNEFRGGDHDEVPLAEAVVLLQGAGPATDLAT